MFWLGFEALLLSETSMLIERFFTYFTGFLSYFWLSAIVFINKWIEAYRS